MVWQRMGVAQSCALTHQRNQSCNAQVGKLMVASMLTVSLRKMSWYNDHCCAQVCCDECCRAQACANHTGVALGDDPYCMQARAIHFLGAVGENPCCVAACVNHTGFALGDDPCCVQVHANPSRVALANDPCCLSACAKYTGVALCDNPCCAQGCVALGNNACCVPDCANANHGRVSRGGMREILVWE